MGCICNWSSDRYCRNPACKNSRLQESIITKDDLLNLFKALSEKYLEGKALLREAIFKDVAVVQKCTRILETSDAEKNITSNSNTGSVLLEYDPEKIPMDKIEPLIPFFMELKKLARNYSDSKREAVMCKLQELEDMIKKSW